MITKIHAYLVRELNLAENEEEKLAVFMDRMFQITIEAFWTKKVLIGSRMDHVLPGEHLTETHLLSIERIPQIHHKIIYLSNSGNVRDAWSRKFHYRTSSAAH